MGGMFDDLVGKVEGYSTESVKRPAKVLVRRTIETF
jgi:hypothetical protein